MGWENLWRTGSPPRSAPDELLRQLSNEKNDERNAGGGGHIGVAVLYLLVPLATNRSGSGVWLVLPTGLSFVVFFAAAYACGRLAEAKLQQGRVLVSAVAAMGCVLWGILLYLTLSYCPQ